MIEKLFWKLGRFFGWFYYGFTHKHGWREEGHTVTTGYTNEGRLIVRVYSECWCGARKSHVRPIYDSELDLSDKKELCEKLYDYIIENDGRFK